MRKEYSWVRERLYAWGHWRRKDVPGLGYPTITADARLRDSPGRSTKPNHGLDYWPPTEEVRETDQLIMSLEPVLTMALWCRYVQEVESKRGAVICGLDNPAAYWNTVEKAERAMCREIRKIA